MVSSNNKLQESKKLIILFQVDTGSEGSSGAELKGFFSWTLVVPKSSFLKLMVVFLLYLMSGAAVKTLKEGSDATLAVMVYSRLHSLCAPYSGRTKGRKSEDLCRSELFI